VSKLKPGTLARVQPPIDTPTIARAAAAELESAQPGWSVDMLLTHPKQAMDLCSTVRLKLGRRLEDHEILHALLNARKRSLI
jgi:hypothetical protein